MRFKWKFTRTINANVRRRLIILYSVMAPTPYNKARIYAYRNKIYASWKEKISLNLLSLVSPGSSSFLKVILNSQPSKINYHENFFLFYSLIILSSLSPFSHGGRFFLRSTSYKISIASFSWIQQSKN